MAGAGRGEGGNSDGLSAVAWLQFEWVDIVQRVPNKPNNECTSTAQTEQIAELEAARDEATAKIESLESSLAALPPPTRNRIESAARTVSLNSIRQNCKRI